MIEVTNKSKSPTQIMVRSKVAPKAFTTINIPGVGMGKNVILISDEQHTDNIDRIEKTTKLIKTKRLPNKPSKGE